METEFIIEPQNQDLEENKKLKVSWKAPPVAGPGCRVCFSGGLTSSPPFVSPLGVVIPFQTHVGGYHITDVFGGNNFDSEDRSLAQLAPNAMATTFDSIFVDTTTRVKVYDGANVSFDSIGPFILNNAKWRGMGYARSFPTWAGGEGQYEDEYGNPIDNFWKRYGVRDSDHFDQMALDSQSDMHGWPKGRIFIQCKLSRFNRNDDGELTNMPDDYCYKYENGRWVSTPCYDDNDVLIPGSETPNTTKQIGLVEEGEEQPDSTNIVRYGISNR